MQERSEKPAGSNSCKTRSILDLCTYRVRASNSRYFWGLGTFPEPQRAMAMERQVQSQVPAWPLVVEAPPAGGARSWPPSGIACVSIC